MTDYKLSKEAFVSGMTGSSVGHINALSLCALASVAVYSAVRTRFPSSKSWQFLVEYCLLVLPLLLSITTFALKPSGLLALLLIVIGAALAFERREAGVPLPQSSHSTPASSPTTEKRDGGQWTYPSAVVPLPALTTYRAHMLLLTSLCILAVDFPAFPRSLAKCETFGVSLMDIGVGSFVFSSGIISAIALIKNPANLTGPLLPKIVIVFRKCAPLLVLGVLRTLSVKGTEYPEHVTEYGVHWNFFFTLALIPVLQVLCHPIMVKLPIALIGAGIAVFQQVILSSGLTHYVLDSPRTNVISANKEGLVSLPGYLAIHLFGVSVGTLILPPTPSYFRRRLREFYKTSTKKRTDDSDSDSDEDNAVQRTRAENMTTLQTRENDKTAIELCSYAVLWWASLLVLNFAGIGGGVSRRLVNLQYIIWVVAYNTSFLLGYIIIDLIFFPSPFSRSTYSPTSKLKVHLDTHLSRIRIGEQAPGVYDTAPTLFEAVNKNGLLFFLLANIATGLINLSLPTMYTPDWAAFIVLTAYSGGICFFAWSFRNKRLYNL